MLVTFITHSHYDSSPFLTNLNNVLLWMYTLCNVKSNGSYILIDNYTCKTGKSSS